jgi:hypothetical protein
MVVAARQRNIYVAVMLFQGWSIGRKALRNGNPWPLFVARRSSDDPSVVAYQHSHGLIDKVVRRIREERIGRSIQHYDLTRQGYEMFSIEQLLHDPDRRATMAEACRRVVLRDFTLDIQARRYAAYYEAVLQASGVSVTQAVPELT